jgi:hypothetical protein
METIQTLNRRLVDYYGTESSTDQPMFRIVWANDEREFRLVGEVAGITLLYPEVREVTKYPYMKDLFVLERLVIIPDENAHELPAAKLSYEPLWAYCDANRNPVPPVWVATQFIVDTLYAALGKKSMARYVDSEKNTTMEGREQRIAEIQTELFGNETDTGDALRYKQGIVVPNTIEKSEE